MARTDEQRIHELEEQVAELTGVIGRLRDNAMIRSIIDGSPALAWPVVIRSPLTGAKYHMVREVTTGHLELIAGEPDKSNWSDA